MLPEDAAIPIHFDVWGRADWLYPSKLAYLLYPCLSLLFGILPLALHVAGDKLKWQQFNFPFGVSLRSASPRDMAVQRDLLLIYIGFLSVAIEAFSFLVAVVHIPQIVDAAARASKTSTSLAQPHGIPPAVKLTLLVALLGSTFAYFWRAFSLASAAANAGNAAAADLQAQARAHAQWQPPASSGGDGKKAD